MIFFSLYSGGFGINGDHSLHSTDGDEPQIKYHWKGKHLYARGKRGLDLEDYEKSFLEINRRDMVK